MKPLIVFIAMSAAFAAATPASAQDVVMRRPLPKSATTGPSDLKPQVVNCSEGRSSFVNSATWVSTGWVDGPAADPDNPSCTTQTKSFRCQVEAYCLAEGETPGEAAAQFVDADDSVCESFSGTVSTFDPDDLPPIGPGGLDLPPMM